MTFSDAVAFENGVLAIVAACAGIPVPVAQRDRAAFTFAPMSGADATAKLETRVLSLRNTGLDELRTEYDPDVEIDGDTYEPNPDDPEERLGGIVYRQTGQRRVVLEARLTLDRGDKSALTYAERIRNRCRLPSAFDAFDALGAGLASVSEARHMPYVEETDGLPRERSLYVIEIVLNVSSDETDSPVTTIETVGTSEEIED